MHGKSNINNGVKVEKKKKKETYQGQRRRPAGSIVVLHPECTTLEPYSFSSTESSRAFQAFSIHYPLKDTDGEEGQEN